MAERLNWMITCVNSSFGTDEGKGALSTGPTSGIVKDFLNGSGPPCLFVAMFIPKEDTDSPRAEVASSPLLVAHTGLNGRPYATAGMAEVGRVCYFIRDGKVKLDVAQDLSVLFGEFRGDPSEGISAFLQHCIKPITETLGPAGKSSTSHVNGFLKSLDRLTKELDETTAAMAHNVTLKMPDAKLAEQSGSVAALAAAASKRKKQEFGEMVTECQAVIKSWSNDIELYISTPREQPASPFIEVEYWRRRTATLTSIENQLKSKSARVVQMVLSKSPLGVVDLSKWKTVDLLLTEAKNESRDNLKYLLTLERYLKPLSKEDPVAMVDGMMPILNAVKMIHTIARYYNTPKALTTLLTSVATQVISQCRSILLQSRGDSTLWEENPANVVTRLEQCRAIQDAFISAFEVTKAEVAAMPGNQRFDVDELAIFGKIQLFGRRTAKLAELFTTTRQFTALAGSKIDGIEEVVEKFNKVQVMLRKKAGNILDFTASGFDRDYVLFKSQVDELDKFTLEFIDDRFEEVSGSILQSLDLLTKYHRVFEREKVRKSLDRKFISLFLAYGEELEEVKALYEREKQDPPLGRNLPPVAGNIQWSKLLLERCEAPMRRFEDNPAIEGCRDYKRIVKTYNRLVRTLVAFEILWFQAWCQAIEKAKAGLSATLIVRHPDDENLYVNFDPDLFQLMREARCLERMHLSMPIPESARVLVLQEAKFKRQYSHLVTMLNEYDRIVTMVVPVTAMLLRPHFQDLELLLKPGMTTLTWMSMNIEKFIVALDERLVRLATLVSIVNDIVATRIERHLRLVSQTVLVDVPQHAVTMSQFIDMQDEYIRGPAAVLEEKNVEVERAVNDLVKVIKGYPLNPHIQPVPQEDVDRITTHYNHFLYQALLHSAKNSLVLLKKRITASGSEPFFELNVQLVNKKIALTPNLEEIQSCVNNGAFLILKSLRKLYDWGQDSIPAEKRKSFFTNVTNDFEIVRVVLLLNGSIMAAAAQSEAFLEAFERHNWLWNNDINKAYAEFLDTNPSLQDYEAKFSFFASVMMDLNSLPECTEAACCKLNIKNLKQQVEALVNDWKLSFASKLHMIARAEMTELLDYISAMEKKLNRPVRDLLSLQYMMNNLREVRESESKHLVEVRNLEETFELLTRFLPEGAMTSEELDASNVLDTTYKKLSDHAENCSQDVANMQAGFKRGLLKDVSDFKADMKRFRDEWITKGSQGNVDPDEAIDRLGRFREGYNIRQRKNELYSGGEQLFKLPVTVFPEMAVTSKEITTCESLFGLYSDVTNSIEAWKQLTWAQVLPMVDDMLGAMDGYSARCKKQPKKVREFPGYIQTRDKIEEFQVVLPMIQELSKQSIRTRHWEQVLTLMKHLPEEEIEMWLDTVTFQELLDMSLHTHEEEIIEVTDMADKELKIETEKKEIESKWNVEEFTFKNWKDRGVPNLTAYGALIDELDEATMIVQTMLTMKAVSPFRPETQELLKTLSETADVIDRWLKVQTMWCSLESVFMGGDIAKQLPKEAKMFLKVDKEFGVQMDRAAKTKLVLEACANEALRAELPVMFTTLEQCQRSLEGYLEQKRDKFPRFYFVSDAVLLLILSQGSDPLSMNAYYDKVFDSLDHVTHDKKDKTIITHMVGYNDLKFVKPVNAKGNIEDWLNVVLYEQRHTMKVLCEDCASDVLTGPARTGTDELRVFVDRHTAQYALLGIQFLWTEMMETALVESVRNKKILPECEKNQGEILRWMSSWCLTDLGSKSNRKKIETLVTVQVHQKDVAQHLKTLHKANKLKLGKEDFEWLMQARFYWVPKGFDDIVDFGGECRVTITEVSFKYNFEYLGSKERLVITPLTDRCYITLAQALGMFFGGAPAGPAGTGKTETTKDLGNTLGLYVVVTNCGDQMHATDLAKIMKGLSKGGLWGCFDEFNRITLPVLSVVAQLILVINDAKKVGLPQFQFPGDDQIIRLNPVCAYFITMNPGYAGRQELPENLKALFRGMMMMVPNFETIMAVKLCSQGYNNYIALATKFFQLYDTCKQQLSKQRHYDWGLRNILAVLRTAGSTKRTLINPDFTLPKGKHEDILLFQTLRDMNLSKMVAQDVPLFLSLLQDLFPKEDPPVKASYPELFAQLPKSVSKFQKVYHDDWVLKIIQFYETTRVRHGIMLVGPSGGGKSNISNILMDALIETTKTQYKMPRMNPKAVKPAEMYGMTDPQSQEWVTGVFAAIWARANGKNNAFITWLMMDGPVDAIWIEDLNTVLDDNKILTLANGDRIPMTENCKIMFEVETLKNASPATVSRAGIIYVSDTDLDWSPVAEGIIRLRPENQRATLRTVVVKYMGESNPIFPGTLFNFIIRNCSPVQEADRVGLISSLFDLLSGLLDVHDDQPPPIKLSKDDTTLAVQLEKVFLYSLIWGIAGLLDSNDRVKLDAWLRGVDNTFMPVCGPKETIYEYFLDESCEFKLWKPEKWTYPKTEHLDFSNLLVPTMDSTRAIFLISTLHKQRKQPLLVGEPGTAKTSTVLMFFDTLPKDTMLQKQINFSSATVPRAFQDAIEADLEKRGGKNFGPPPGKKMTVFVDDISMPEINKWGDQITNEMVRILVEQSGFPFLDKDRRGDWKVVDDLQYLAAMGKPGGGKNDIPNRLKRQFFKFNMVLPSIVSINDIYGQMLNGRFTKAEFDSDTMNIVKKMTQSTIHLWDLLKAKMLPTPAKFHYIFNMRDLSRVFQGILLTPKSTILMGGGILTEKDGDHFYAKQEPATTLVKLWQHECDRVFCDKLTNYVDKDMYGGWLKDITSHDFGEEIQSDCESNPPFLISCLRDDVYDEEEVLIERAPKVYEFGGSLVQVRATALEFLDQHNTEFPQKKMELVLFDDALKHLFRISRLIEMPRGSALLVGVGGSGKQSLTRLASYISRSWCFQIVLTKSYNLAALDEDIRGLYRSAGHKKQQTTFLFTDSEIKDEMFLEKINTVLMTGNIPGLFAKDEMLGIIGDLQPEFAKLFPDLPETQANIWNYFLGNVRDNLHIVLCFSPMNKLYPIRAQKFPGLFNCPTIDFFLPWPQDALINVSEGFIKDFEISCDKAEKQALIVHMGVVHSLVVEVCDEYFSKMRRQVYQTPKSFLSFLNAYRSLYKKKLDVLVTKEATLRLGLEKLIQGSEDVAAMKLVLADEQVKLDKATKETNEMLEGLEISSAQAQKEGDQVAVIKANCEADAARIAKEKESCEADLAEAQPFVDMANEAINSIQKKDIQEISANKKPVDIIKLIFDVLLILFQKTIESCKPFQLSFSSGKILIDFFESSFFPHGQRLVGSSDFLAVLQAFGAEGGGKDTMNEETVELIMPYLDLDVYNADVAKAASSAAAGLCTFSGAMKSYYYAAKIVKPKLEALSIALGQLAEANANLAAAEEKLAGVQAKVAELQEMFQNQMAEKKRIEDGANALSRKAQQASELISGLSGEQKRWGEDANAMVDMKHKLVGDCAVAAAFVSYCGPFNQEFRSYMLKDKFTKDCQTRGVPVSPDIEVISFSVDQSTIADWNMEGLPTDPLSIQNGILITQASRYPLLIDPQSQALTWIKSREKDRTPYYGTTTLAHPKLKDQLEFAMVEGLAFIVQQVENTIDPMFDPVLERQYISRGKKKFVNVSDKMMEIDVKNFTCFFISRLPNPAFSPELQAKTCVVDFTVTQLGLEEQLLGLVIGKEQKALEEQLEEVLNEVNQNSKSLLALDASLLSRLTSNTGNLLEDEELIEVLATTKRKAKEVQEKLKNAAETKKNINEKREQFRPVATRGSVLYFAIVDMSGVNCMYQTSLVQFEAIFMQSMNLAEKAALAQKRVGNIISTMTYICYRYINKGLYESDKLTFILVVCTKILITAGLLSSQDMALFLRGGASLDRAQAPKKPFKWLTEDDAWYNALQLSQSIKLFANLPSDMVRNESMWRQWYEHDEPEAIAIPDYEDKIAALPNTAAFLKLVVVRSLRLDRTNLVGKEFVAGTETVRLPSGVDLPVMGPTFTEPITDTMETIYEQSDQYTPIIFLLSKGTNPTDGVLGQARKLKIPAPPCISMGEGMEIVGSKAIEAGVENGTWVMLENCELGLGLMIELEEMLGKVRDTVHPGFRLWLSALPDKDFPLGLLQMSTKCTNEPPMGLKAGLMRSYTVMVDQDKLERIDGKAEGIMWRKLLFTLCYLHSVVQERRKFGALGWCIPYEYNQGDQFACSTFLEKHLYNGPISWPTVRYMVCDVQYGGKITDSLDRRLFSLYAEKWLDPVVLTEGYTLQPQNPILKIPQNFQYLVKDFLTLEEYRAYAASFPEIDSPECLGLHPNADLTYRQKSAKELLEIVGNSQPKGGGGGGGGPSKEDLVYEQAGKLHDRMPEYYVEDIYKQKIQSLGGLSVPLNMFLFQEIQRLQEVLDVVKTMLNQMRLAIKGEVVMTDELATGIGALGDARAPRPWVYSASGTEFSWIIPMIASWFGQLINIDKQSRTWMETGRPNSFWLAGFSNPAGFLTAMTQEVARKHSKAPEYWALDEMVYNTEGTTMKDFANVSSAPNEGVYLHGLTMDGGAYDIKNSVIVESVPKILFVDLPVMLVSAAHFNIQKKKNKEDFGPQGPYMAPTYKYAVRGDGYPGNPDIKNFIFYVNLKCTPEKNPLHWGLRGLALFCNSGN